MKRFFVCLLASVLLLQSTAVQAAEMNDAGLIADSFEESSEIENEIQSDNNDKSTDQKTEGCITGSLF